jgi:hypothetical protein
MVRGRWSGSPRPWARVARSTAAMAAAGFVALSVAAPAAHAASDGLSAQLAQTLGPVETLVGHTVLSPGQQAIDLPEPLPAPVSTPALPNLPVVHTVEGTVNGVLSTVSNVAAPDASTGSAASPAAVMPTAAPPSAATSATPTNAISSTQSTVRRGSLNTTGSTAVLRLARSAVALLSLLIAAIGFLVMQSTTERRNPRLFLAPLDRRESELEFQ